MGLRADSEVVQERIVGQSASPPPTLNALHNGSSGHVHHHHHHRVLPHAHAHHHHHAHPLIHHRHAHHPHTPVPVARPGVVSQAALSPPSPSKQHLQASPQATQAFWVRELERNRNELLAERKRIDDLLARTEALVNAARSGNEAEWATAAARQVELGEEEGREDKASASQSLLRAPVHRPEEGGVKAPTAHSQVSSASPAHRPASSTSETSSHSGSSGHSADSAMQRKRRSSFDRRMSQLPVLAALPLNRSKTLTPPATPATAKLRPLLKAVPRSSSSAAVPNTFGTSRTKQFVWGAIPPSVVTSGSSTSKGAKNGEGSAATPLAPPLFEQRGAATGARDVAMDVDGSKDRDDEDDDEQEAREEYQRTYGGRTMQTKGDWNGLAKPIRDRGDVRNSSAGESALAPNGAHNSAK